MKHAIPAGMSGVLARRLVLVAVAIAVLAAGAVLFAPGMFAGSMPAAVSDNLQLSRDTSAARYAATDEADAAVTADVLQLNWDINAARYAAFGEADATLTADELQLSRDACAARYAAMGTYYAAAQTN